MIKMKYVLAGFSCAALLALAPVPQVSASALEAIDVSVNYDKQYITVDAGDNTKIYVAFPTVKNGTVNKEGTWSSYDVNNEKVEVDLSSQKLSKDFYVAIKGNYDKEMAIYHFNAVDSKFDKGTVDNETGEVTLKYKSTGKEAENLQYCTSNGYWENYIGKSTVKSGYYYTDLSKYLENGATLRFRTRAVEKTTTINKEVEGFDFSEARIVDDSTNIDGIGVESVSIYSKSGVGYGILDLNLAQSMTDTNAISSKLWTTGDKHLKVTSVWLYNGTMISLTLAITGEISDVPIYYNGTQILTVSTQKTTKQVDYSSNFKIADTSLTMKQSGDKVPTYDALGSFASDEVKVKVGKRKAGPKIAVDYKKHTFTIASGKYSIYQDINKVYESSTAATSKLEINADSIENEDKTTFSCLLNSGAIEAWTEADTKNPRSKYSTLTYDAKPILGAYADSKEVAEENRTDVTKVSIADVEDKTKTVTASVNTDTKNKTTLAIKNSTDSDYEVYLAASGAQAPDAKTKATAVGKGKEVKIKNVTAGQVVFIRKAANTKAKTWSSDFEKMGVIVVGTSDTDVVSGSAVK